MARYTEIRVPRGPTREWKIVIEEDHAAGPGIATTFAADVQREHRVLREVPASSLDGVTLLPAGAPLERGERFLDLHDPARGEFPGDGHSRVRPGRRVIARRDVAPDVWRNLLDAADRIVSRR